MKSIKIFLSSLCLCFIILSTVANAQEQGVFGTYFKHVVTPENNLNTSSYMDHPEINNNPSAIIIISPTLQPNEIPAVYNVNLFYNTNTGRWAIRNVNAPINLPFGTAFDVLIPDASQDAFRVTAPGGSSSFGFSNPATDANPDKVLFITPIFPSFSAPGIGNRQYVAMYAPDPFNMWGIAVNLSTQIQQGFTFNVLAVDASDFAFVHRVSESNASVTEIDTLLFNLRPEAGLLFQRQFNFEGGGGSVSFNDQKKSAAYIDDKWNIQIDGNGTFNLNEDYNVALLSFSQGITCSDPITLVCDETAPASYLSGENDNELSGAQDCSDLPEPASSGSQRWYSHTAQADGAITASIHDTVDFNIVMHVYTGSCGNFTCVESTDFECSENEGALLTFEATEGETYYIRVGSAGSHDAAFSLNLACESTASAYARLHAAPQFTLFPNPAGRFMHVQTSTRTEGMLTYEITDISGKILLSGVQSDAETFRVNLATLNRGTYLIRLSSSNFVAVEKFVVAH